jgi:hypothetical protein
MPNLLKHRRAKRSVLGLAKRLALHILISPGGRISLAIALSLLVHAALLFGPRLVELAPIIPPLPPLIAKLEPMPAVQPVTKRRLKPRAPPEPVPLTPPVADTPPPDAAKIQPAASAPETATVADSESDAPPATEQAATSVDAAHEEAKPAHPLPRHAQLTFIVYKGSDFPIGEARHRLEIGNDNSYTLQVGMNTTGLASLFKTFEMKQQSSGTANALGLRPDEYSENRITAKGQQALTAKFDWANRQLAFSNGNNLALPDGAQDILSFLYQLSQLPLDQATLPLYISNGRKLEHYELAVGAEEEIMTRMGKLRVLPLRRVHAPGEEGQEIWLGLEYRLLPVKIRQIDRNGEIAGEMVISEIRVSDE